MTSYSHLEIVIDSGQEFETDALTLFITFALVFGRFVRWQWERDRLELGINGQDLLIWDLVFSITSHFLWSHSVKYNSMMFENGCLKTLRTA